jgi:hypothetical protein
VLARESVEVINCIRLKFILAAIHSYGLKLVQASHHISCAVIYAVQFSAFTDTTITFSLSCKVLQKVWQALQCGDEFHDEGCVSQVVVSYRFSPWVCGWVRQILWMPWSFIKDKEDLEC